jgi:uncharacterized protein YecE (DUF72 family)
MVRIGTSGWSYAHWARVFYPLRLPGREQLLYLARHFDTVELNASFYRLPRSTSFEKWDRETPDGFVFAVKVPKTITHNRKLHDVTDDWHQLREAVGPLEHKVAVYLAQFAPSFRASDENIERMRAFLQLVQGQRVAFELRHASWFEPPALDVFIEAKACVVQAESSRYPHTPPGFAPADFTYYRLHGPRELYASQYTDEELEYWGDMIRADVAAGRDVYAYFDNDFSAYAIEDARRLRELLGIVPVVNEKPQG